MTEYRPQINPIYFERLGPCFYERGPFRPPRRGEYYLSGAVLEGWRAPNDLTTPYHIVRPTHKAVAKVTAVRGEPVTAGG